MPERITPERSAHPVLFLILFLPMGVSNGYVVVTLGYLLTHAGVSVAAVAGLVSPTVLFCETDPLRGTAPAVNRRLSRSVVLPLP